jgi:hypothetical protein
VVTRAFIAERRDEAVPRWYSMTIVAQDPTVHVRDEASGAERILTARVRVPADWL